jgi:hypothetical protein
VSLEYQNVYKLVLLLPPCTCVWVLVFHMQFTKVPTCKDHSAQRVYRVAQIIMTNWPIVLVSLKRVSAQKIFSYNHHGRVGITLGFYTGGPGIPGGVEAYSALCSECGVDSAP